MTGDQIVLEAQQCFQQYGLNSHRPAIKLLMDTVVGVPGYSLDSATPQGYIRNKFMSERIEYNHIIDFDTLISKFWEGVFMYLSKAVPEGEKVQARSINLATSITESVHYGREYEVRATNMQPIQFLRMQGTAHARKYITKCYRERLRNLCNDCGEMSALSNVREFDEGCAKCGSMKSEILGRVMRRRERKCECGEIRLAVMKPVCGSPNLPGCGSTNVAPVEVEEMVIGEDEDVNESEDMMVADSETRYLDEENERSVQDFVEACIRAMPGDPNKASGESQNRKILRVLVDPKYGAEVCKSCHSSAEKVCEQKCNDEKCEHHQIPNPKQCCGAAVFNISQCINYSKKIGDWAGYTSSLANRRVSKVRAFVRVFAQKNTRRFPIARLIANLMG